MIWNAPSSPDMRITLADMEHLFHLLVMDSIKYEIYDVEKGRWRNFDPTLSYPVIPVTLPLILRPRNRDDSRCLGLSRLIQHVHFVADASDLHVGPVPERYRADSTEEVVAEGSGSVN